jgi:uncharacterized membrane protein YeiH
VPIGRVERWVGVLNAVGLGLFAVVGAALAVLAYETGTYGTATALAAVAAAATLRIVPMLRGWYAWHAPGTGRT